MSESRRKFLKAGLMSALFAAVSGRKVLGQSWKARDGNPGNNPPAQSDPLFSYSEATFKSYLNSIFQMQTFNGVFAMTLQEIESMPAPKGGECFTLLFRGGSLPQPQNEYMFSHGALGTFQMFVVPTDADQSGAQGYLATVNRLSQADFANLSAPTRIAGGSRSRTSTGSATTTNSTTTNAATTMQAPAITNGNQSSGYYDVFPRDGQKKDASEKIVLDQ